jgi:myo-inositol-1(or 4)-monophosphatase
METDYLSAAVAAAIKGGKVLLQYFRKLDPATIEEKSKNDLVTEADRASEQVIQGELTARFSAHSFLGEESGLSGTSDMVWIVDPLDGTLNFVQGLPQWCISVALWDAEGPVVGCVYDPLRRDLFLAQKSLGAKWYKDVDANAQFGESSCLEGPNQAQSMKVSKQPVLDGAFLATGFAYQMADRFPRYIKALEPVFYRAKAIRRAGSAALDLAHTAAGLYDGYFEMGLRTWDMAAGALLIKETGGKISDWEGGDNWWESGYVVAGNPCVHPQLVEETGKSRG